MTKKEIKKLNSVADVLASLQLSVKVSKEKTNKFGNYNYRNAEDVLEAIKEELSKEIYPPASIVTNIEPISIGGRFFIKCNATLLANKEVCQADGYAELEVSKKGMDLAQLTGAATSYAKKYALGNLFAIDDSKDDPDSKDNTQSGNPKGEFDDWGKSDKGKKWCEENFKSLKTIIEYCKSPDQLKTAWKDNMVTVNRLKKYDKTRYEMILDAKDGMKLMFDAELEPSGSLVDEMITKVEK